ncbi:MAG: aldose epimerase family protein [Eubacteriales bacterium]
MTVTKTLFGYIGKKEVNNFTLLSEKLEVCVTEYGARIKTLVVRDKKGDPRNVVLGLDTLEGYIADKSYLGAVIGRHSNRIEGAQVTINGVEYGLDKNEGTNNLHSGANGFHARIFAGEIVNDTVELSLESPHLDQGFPGTMHIKIIYSLTARGGLHIEYWAVSDQDTVCNLTNHSYFNLEGNNSGTILDHRIMIAADFYTPIKAGCLPTGEILYVKGTPFDFTSEGRIGDPVEAAGSIVADGYDHNYVLRKHSDDPAATVCAPDSGICMQVFTTQPGIQFYSGNFLDGTSLSNGKTASKHQALCLETQYFPNAFAYSHFPQPILKAGEQMSQSTEYRFLVK